MRNLTRLQVKGLFTGRIGSWHKVGGLEEPVRVVLRSPASGTYRLFQELVLDAEAYSERAESLPTTAAVTQAVRNDRAAVGYGGLGWGRDLVQCAIDGVAPSAESVRSGAYPLSRYLYLRAVDRRRRASVSRGPC